MGQPKESTLKSLKRRKTLQLVFGVPMAVAFVLLVLQCKGIIDVTEYRISEALFYGIGFSVCTCYFGITLLTWRCPECGVYLGRSINAAECSDCGASFVPER